MHLSTHTRTHKLFLSDQSSEKVQSWLCYIGKGRGGFGGHILELDNLSASLMALSLLLALCYAADCTTPNKLKLPHYGNNCSG